MARKKEEDITIIIESHILKQFPTRNETYYISTKDISKQLRSDLCTAKMLFKTLSYEHAT